jgi:ASPIC and UnbV/FG-GAP-like repeat
MPRAGFFGVAMATAAIGAAWMVVAAAWQAARQDAPQPRAVNWDRARAEVAKYRATLDSSGLVDVDAYISPRVDAEDLQALCQARREAVGVARVTAQRALGALPRGRDPVTDDRRATLYRQLGAIASFEGDMATAREQFQAGREALAPYAADYPDLRAKWLGLDQAVGVASLRQGEVENCVAMPNMDRCIFPLRAGGVHQKTAGAQQAFERLQPLAAASPDNLELRWLLNVSAMALGRYPEAVPAAARIPASVFASGAKLPRFPNVAHEAGIARMDTAGGTIADDFDEDGLIDLVLTSVDYCTPVRLYHNRGDGTFEDRTAAAGLLTQLGGLNATQTDYNNDGHLDLFIHRGGWEIPMRNSLLRNNGDGTFTDVTKAAGLSSPLYSTHSAVWFDFDNDGWIDLFVGHELAPSQLFRNRGDGTFEDVTAHAGVGGTAFTKGVVAGDYDNDGYPDLYVSNMFGDNFLYHNNRDGTFTDVAKKLGVEKPFASFPTWFFDYDNDGWLDIFVVSYPNSVEEFVKHYLGQPPIAETLRLYHNNGNGTFTDVTRQVGLARVVPSMGANFGDLDNDGFLDVYLGTGAPSLSSLMPNIMLKNEAGKRFVDVTEATGTGHLQKGHGIAFADLDNDGDEDIVLNVGGAVPGDSYDDALFANPGGSGNNWISVKLVGVRSNRAAIGAKITVTLGRAGGASPLRMREVNSGGSFGANSFVQHIGVGHAKVIETLDIWWPASRTHQTFKNVPVNQFLEIREGADTYERRNVPPPFAIGGGSSAVAAARQWQ